MHLIAIALVVVVTACSSPAETSIRVEVAFDDSWGVNGFALEVTADGETPREELVDAAGELLLLVPDDWADRPVTIDLDGLRGSQRWAHGLTHATPVRDGEVGATVVLTLLPCGAWCTEGAMQCEQGGVSICEQRDSDACLEWSEPVTCPDSAPFCSLGVCDATCVDECAAGETRCEGTDSLRACGQAEGDSDDCLDWLPAVACGTGEVCSADQCNTECTDECVDATVECSGAGTRTCGDLDANDCLEWGPVVACDDGESCSGDACAPGCTDDCTTAACDDGSFVACGQYDLDACLDWSPGTSCTAANPCSEGACTADGCISTPLVCEDPPDPICVAGGTTARSYASTGSCGGNGVCNYAFTDTPCPGSCVDGACACAETSCTIVDVATRQNEATAVAVDDTHVYWTASAPAGNTVMRRSKALGATAVETVATGQEGASALAVDDAHVYWTTFSKVMRRAKTLGATAVETVASGQDGASDVAVDATYVYWTAYDDQTVMRRAKSLGGAAVETVASGQTGGPHGVAVDDTHVYWTSYSGGTVRRRAKTLGVAVIETIATGQNSPAGVAVDDSYVYWTSFFGNTVMRWPTAVGPVETVATAQDFAIAVAVDGNHVYWATSDAVMRRAKALGAATVETVAGEQVYPQDVVVDASHVYWTSVGEDVVRRVSRCACDL